MYNSQTMQSLLYTLLILSAAAIVILVLLQQGKGADMGAAFGSGSAGSLFGAAGSANFLSRSTAVAATIFFAVCIALTWMSARPSSGGGGVMQGVTTTQPAKDAAGKVPSDAAPAAATPPKSDVPK